MVDPHTQCCNLFGHRRSSPDVTGLVINMSTAWGYVTAMVTRIHKGVRARLFLREHREAKGVSAEQMAGRLGIERESVYRLEREQERMDPQKQANYAAALGIAPEALWRPPGVPSIDELLSGAPDDVKTMAADIVQRLVAGRR